MFFNQLTPAEAERLAILSEELGETQQAIGKILRHGYESHHPDGGPSNRESLERELGDIAAAINMMYTRKDVDIEKVDLAAKAKAKKIVQYLHHQEGAI